MQGNFDARLLWVMATMAVSSSTLWTCLVEAVSTDTQWPGWLLLFVTRDVLPFPFPCGKNEDNPYRGKTSVSILMEWLDPKYVEELFDVTKLEKLLTSIPRNVVYMGAVDIDEEADFEPSDVDVVFLVGAVDEDESVLPMSFSVRGRDGDESIYEQVYKVRTSNDGADWTNSGLWKASAYIRHAKFSMKNCWKMERKQVTSKSRFPRCGVWDCVMFVKTTTPSEHMRGRYLESMGGQTKLVCPWHKFPLTVTPSRNSRKCIMAVGEGLSDVCHRLASLECPLSSCTMGLCKVHVESELDLRKQRILEGLGMEENVLRGGMVHESDELVASQAVSSSLDIEATQSVDNDCIESCGRDELSELEPDMVSVDDSIERDNMLIAERSSEVGYGIESSSSNHVRIDLRQDNNESEDDGAMSEDSNEDEFLPFTTAQADEAIHVKTNFRSRFEAVGLHVLLNKFGSLLQRKGRQLIGSRGEQGFLHRIVATSPGCSIPLAYPEAMMFPSIFWKQEDDGSFLGAIPSCLWRGEKECKKYGFAGMSQHAVSRITNSSLQSSTNPRFIFFCFDIMNNLMSHGKDNRIILRRGFEHMIGPHGIKSFADSSLMNKDLVESRSQVVQLGAALSEYGESGDSLCSHGPYKHTFGRTMFFTHTCNQSKHPGVAPIRQWLNSVCDVIERQNRNFPRLQDELKQSMCQLAAVQMIRSWRRVASAFIEYMVHSIEYYRHSSGQKILLHWYRFEDGQQSPGALPHIHAIFFLEEDKSNPAETHKTEACIRCSVRDVIDPIEASQYVKEGLLADVDEIYDVQDDAARIQKHRCKRPRCIQMTGDGGEVSKCRNPDYAKINPHPSMYGLMTNVPKHSPRALALFEKMNLVTLDEESGRVLSIDEKLWLGKHVYPADYGEHFVPCLGRIFAATRSTDNAQLCTYYMNSRYLAHYNAAVDDNHRVFVKGCKGENEFRLQHEEVPNTKISSHRYFLNKLMDKKRQRHAIKGRPLGLPEAVSNMLGHAQIQTDINFVFVPSVPMEERVAHDRPGRKMESVDGDADLFFQEVKDEVPEAVRVRNMLDLPRNRQFKESEVTTIMDALNSPLTIDKITAYGCRPPELRFVDSPTEYYKCFSRKAYEAPRRVVSDDGDCVFISTQERFLHRNIYKCGWVDGFDCRVLVRPCAIRRVLSLPKCTGRIRRLFIWLKRADDERNGYCSDGCPYGDGPIENYISSDDDEEAGNYPSRVHTMENEVQHYHDKVEGRIGRRLPFGDVGNADNGVQRKFYGIARSVSLGNDSERSISSVDSGQPSWIVDDFQSGIFQSSLASSGVGSIVSDNDVEDDSFSYDVLSDSHPSLAIDPSSELRGDRNIPMNLSASSAGQIGSMFSDSSADEGECKVDATSLHRGVCGPPKVICCVTQEAGVRGDGIMKRDKSGSCELGVYNPSNVLVTEDGRSVPGSFLDSPQGSSHGSRIRSPLGHHLCHSQGRGGVAYCFFFHIFVWVVSCIYAWVAAWRAR